jgi:hypothetical protein
MVDRGSHLRDLDPFRFQLGDDRGDPLLGVHGLEGAEERP